MVQTSGRRPQAESRRYSTVQLLAMTEERLLEVISVDHSALVTISIADARWPTRSPQVSKLLRSPRWCLAWLDALTGAAASHQVASERMQYEQDDREQDVRAKLRAINRAHAEAREVVRKTFHEDEDQAVRESDPEHTARHWLAKAYPDEYRTMRTALAVEAGGQLETNRATAISDLILAAHRAGDLNAPITENLKALMCLDAMAFRDAVAEDAQTANARNEALRHYLAVSKWRAALDELRDITKDRAQAAGADRLGPLRADLWAMAPEDAYSLLNTRRFYAAVLQRRAECDAITRQAIVDAGENPDLYGSTSLFLEQEAMRRFAEAKFSEYTYILERLAEYCDDDGVIDLDLLPRHRRMSLRREILAGLGRADAYKGEPVVHQGDPQPPAAARTSVKRQVAYALAVMDLEICHRSTIRALLPAGRTRRPAGQRTSINVTSVKFKDALHDLEALGFIQRGQEFVRVVARQQLYDYALAGFGRLPDDFIDLGGAEAATRRAIEVDGPRHPGTWGEQRRRELEKLRQLMGAPSSAQPRIVHRTGRQDRLEVGQHR